MVESTEYSAKKYPIINLYEEWELSPNIIKTLITCGITNKAILRQMHQHDINEIFSKRSQIGDKIFFRHKLQNWREEIKLPSLVCCDTIRVKTLDIEDDLSISPMSSRSSSPEASSSLLKTVAMPLLTPIISKSNQPIQLHNISPPSPHVMQTSSASIKAKFPPMIPLNTKSTYRQMPTTPNLDFSEISRNFEDNFDLEAELRKSFQGQKILENYRKYNILGKSDQNNLTRVVANYHLMTKMPLSAQIYMFYATKIQELFPTESKETYYLPANYKMRRAPRGKLYDRFCNMKRQTRADEESIVQNIRTYGSYQMQTPIYENMTPSIMRFQLEHSEEEYIAIKELLFNINEPWEDIVSEWKKSSPYRLNEIRNDADSSKSIEKWPRYRDPQGFELIDVDFAVMYPDKSVDLLINYDTFCEKIQPIYRSEVKDKWSSKHLELLDNFDVNKDTKDCITALLIHAVMHPPVLPGRIKISITDAQRDLVLVIDDIMNLDNEREKWDPSEPKIIAVGDSFENLLEFYVDYDGILYQLPTFIKCLDTVIKLCFVFNINYPIRNKYIWTFFQQYFFKIESPDCHPKIANLMGKMNS
ncbi:uncharacterized protein LOC132257597 [Phlebotomus argentipes]|uniref:uncharacterized protein LOC132257597 n=1 Tax=Phlebotomus argentipes TaxID=94469 RepID=UPI0028931781|nr:uncharacterized protein LOC132257597 [Phlebotomus argentipes]